MPAVDDMLPDCPLRRSSVHPIRWLLPESAVQWLKYQPTMVQFRSRWKAWQQRGDSHDEVYGLDYFQMVDETTGRSAVIMARSIVDHLNPKTVLDVGCGAGNLLTELRTLGVAPLGVEYAQAALAYCRQRGLEVIVRDLADPQASTASLGRFDLAICLEVAMQLPAVAARNLVRLLCEHADTVLFSSPPCADDRRPLTPWSASRWEHEFAGRGFVRDPRLSAVFRSSWQEQGTAVWFSREPMVFRRAA